MLMRALGWLGAACALLALSWVPFSHPIIDRGVSAVLTRALNAEVAAKEVRLGLIHGFSSKSLTIRREGRYQTEANGFSAIPRLTLFKQRPHILLELNAQDITVGQDLFSELLSTDRAGLLSFDTASALVRIYPKSMDLSEMQATGDDCRVAGEGDITFKERKINLGVSIALSPSIVTDIPESLKENLLGEDPSGFRTFTLAVTGPMNMASVEIRSDRFSFSARTKKI